MLEYTYALTLMHQYVCISRVSACVYKQSELEMGKFFIHFYRIKAAEMIFHDADCDYTPLGYCVMPF